MRAHISRGLVALLPVVCSAALAWGQPTQPGQKPVQRVTIMTNYFHPEGDLRKWADASDLVVVGTVADSRVEVTPSDNEKLPPTVTTIYEVAVGDFVKGAGSDRKVLLRVPGGRVDLGDKILDVVNGTMPRLEKGQRYVLLLKRDDTAAARADGLVYGPLGGADAVFVISPDQRVKAPGQGRLARSFEGKSATALLNELRGK
jgi:hypothetical protein